MSRGSGLGLWPWRVSLQPLRPQEAWKSPDCKIARRKARLSARISAWLISLRSTKNMWQIRSRETLLQSTKGARLHWAAENREKGQSRLDISKTVHACGDESQMEDAVLHPTQLPCEVACLGRSHLQFPASSASTQAQARCTPRSDNSYRCRSGSWQKHPRCCSLVPPYLFRSTV